MSRGLVGFNKNLNVSNPANHQPPASNSILLVATIGEKMKIKSNISPYAIEIEFKKELLYKCDAILKEYVSDKLAAIKSRQRTKNSIMLAHFYERFLIKHSIDIEYAIIISILFCNEFVLIEEQVRAGIINFHHFKNPDFWDGSHTSELEQGEKPDQNKLPAISIPDAVFFTYTTMDNFYPQTAVVISDMLDFSDNHKDFDCYSYFKDLIYV